MSRYLYTGGEIVEISSSLPWVWDIVSGSAPGEFIDASAEPPTVTIDVERAQTAFRVRGWEPLTRGAWRRSDQVVIEDCCATGFDLHFRCLADRAEFAYRWRPRARGRLAARVLRRRFILLTRALMALYPVLWRSGLRGRVPLHAAACTAGDSTVLLAGPAGVGKSTLIKAELKAEAVATSDNLCVTDGRVVWGLAEPLKVEAGEGVRTSHGRRESSLPRRAATLVPDTVAVIRRGLEGAPSVHECDPDTALRSLITGTYMAGELRRYWPFNAALAAGTGLGPVEPPLSDAANRLVHGLRCVEVWLGPTPAPRLSDLLAHQAAQDGGLGA